MYGKAESFFWEAKEDNANTGEEQSVEDGPGGFTRNSS